MDYKNPDNKPALEQSVKELLADYQTLFDHMIADPANYKKSALLYYWLRDYKDYLKNENSFDPNYYPDFERGNLVNVNLGFNVGAEMGGLHYAIVLSKSNRRNPNIVIAPLTSVKPGKDLSHLRPTELALGEELFYMFQVKYNALKTSIPTEIKLLQEAVANHSADSDFAQRVEELGKRIELLEKL